MMSIEVGGGRSATLRFMNRPELSEISKDLGDTRSRADLDLALAG